MNEFEFFSRSDPCPPVIGKQWALSAEGRRALEAAKRGLVSAVDAALPRASVRGISPKMAFLATAAVTLLVFAPVWFFSADRGTGPGPSGQVTPPVIDATTTVPTQTETTVPADHISEDPLKRREWVDSWNARERFIADCMDAQGFEYHPREIAYSDGQLSDGRLGIFSPHNYDVERAVEASRIYGFEMFPNPETRQFEPTPHPSPREQHPNDLLQAAMTPEERRAWGDASSNCVAPAWEAHPAPTRDPEVAAIMDLLQIEFDRQFESDPRVAAARTNAAQCTGDGWGVDDHKTYLEQLFKQETGLDWGQTPHTEWDDHVWENLDFARAEERRLAEVLSVCLADRFATQDLVGIEIEKALIAEHFEELKRLGLIR